MTVPAASAETARFRQGAGRLCLDFIRTLRYRGSADATEELADPAALAAWIRQCAPTGIAPQELPSVREVKDARKLREAVHELLAAARTPAGVSACPAAAREQINRAAGLPLPTPRLDAPADHVHWHAEDPVSATLALISRDAIDLAISAAIARVHECADPTCRVLFFDSSRPGTRRWCSMDTCGNRAKKETLHKKTTRHKP